MLSWAFGPLGLSQLLTAERASLPLGSPLVLPPSAPHEAKFTEPQGLTVQKRWLFLPSRKDADPSGLFPDCVSDLFGP